MKESQKEVSLMVNGVQYSVITRTKEYEHGFPIVPLGDEYTLLISSLRGIHCSGRENFFALKKSVEFFGKFSFALVSSSTFPTSRKMEGFLILFP